MSQSIDLIGTAWGIAAANSDCQDGPIAFKRSLILKEFLAQHPNISWSQTFSKRLPSIQPIKNSFSEVAYLSSKLARAVSWSLEEKHQFCVIGGDHSCAIGTWSGVHLAYPQKKLGLIWLDAHLDAHTPESSESGNIHGMPVAALLGFGHPLLTAIGTDVSKGERPPKLLPEYLLYIGIRSYEAGEQELTDQLGIKVYYMKEVLQRGFKEVFHEAYNNLIDKVDLIGISVDLDGFEPTQVPGTGIHEANGINPEEFCTVLSELPIKKPWVGLEIAEFNPYMDENNKTIIWMKKIIESVFQIK